MKISWKNAINTVILLCLLLGLSACGSSKDIGENTSAALDNLEEMVYVPQFYDAELDVAYVNTGCVIGENVYLGLV